jgi:aspartate aminotransferase
MGESKGVGVTDRMVVVSKHFEGTVPRASAYAESIQGSTILKIAGDIREMLAQGEKVLNLTVGDFRPDQFPIPSLLCDEIVTALRAGETNYPPVAGVAELRQAVCEITREDWGLDYPVESVLIAGGARPLLYSSYMALVDPGDTVLFPVPSWNNHYYVCMAGAKAVPIPVTAPKNFHLDRTDLEPHLGTARLLVLNSPLNPTGTCISRGQLQGICEAIVEENRRRESTGARALFLVYDQVYDTQTFGGVEHVTPVGLVPEMAKYTILIDAVSKGFCGTGLRVGWALGPPAIMARLTAMAGHYGTWAPRAEQVATAKFLRNRSALEAHRAWMRDALHARLDALDQGFAAMRADGLPVEHIAPQGAIYLSIRFALRGKTVAGQRIQSTEDLRTVLLREAGFAVVPFEAFGMPDGDGWVRVSVGAVSVEEIHAGLGRVRKLLEPLA